MRLIEKSIASSVYEALNESFDSDKTAKRLARYKKSNRVRMNESDKYYVSFSSGELNMDVPFNNDKIKRDVIKGKGGKGPDGVETDLVKYIGTKEDLEKLMDKDFDGEYKNNIKKLDESEEVKEEKKVTKVEVLVLPTIKFMWAEGNQDHIKALFGSAEEHDMDFSKFQNAVYMLDQEVSNSGRGGYDKVKYVANIKVKFTYEDGSTSEETSTYTGRVDCGDGYKYVTVSKNMKHFIQDVYKDAEVTVKEDDTAELKESAETGKMTLKDYAMNYFDGDIDIDVTDTEIGMMVAFVYDFNEEPEDNYDRFLNLLGERTKVVKVGNNVLTCDFSSVFKPYEDKLQDFFNMDYSDFNEAYYEAVDNLEPLISGNAGEKTYKELVDILSSKQINESASYEGYTDKEIIEDVIDNFKEITGKEVKDVLNYDEAVEGFFKQGEVESTGESIINYLTKKGLSRSHIDELLYKLDDELTSLWNKL